MALFQRPGCEGGVGGGWGVGGDRWHWQARNCPFCIGQRIYLIKVATVDHLSAVMLLPVFGLILYGF